MLENKLMLQKMNLNITCIWITFLAFKEKILVINLRLLSKNYKNKYTEEYFWVYRIKILSWWNSKTIYWCHVFFKCNANKSLIKTKLRTNWQYFSIKFLQKMTSKKLNGRLNYFENLNLKSTLITLIVFKLMISYVKKY